MPHLASAEPGRSAAMHCNKAKLIITSYQHPLPGGASNVDGRRSSRVDVLGHGNSDAARLQHLLPQVILVIADAAIPPRHCLLLADHDIFGNLVE